MLPVLFRLSMAPPRRGHRQAQLRRLQAAFPVFLPRIKLRCTGAFAVRPTGRLFPGPFGIVSRSCCSTSKDGHTLCL
jgi:hypothetical protein